MHGPNQATRVQKCCAECSKYSNHNLCNDGYEYEEKNQTKYAIWKRINQATE